MNKLISSGTLSELSLSSDSLSGLWLTEPVCTPSLYISGESESGRSSALEGTLVSDSSRSSPIMSSFNYRSFPESGPEKITALLALSTSDTAAAWVRSDDYSAWAAETSLPHDYFSSIPRHIINRLQHYVNVLPHPRPSTLEKMYRASSEFAALFDTLTEAQKPVLTLELGLLVNTKLFKPKHSIIAIEIDADDRDAIKTDWFCNSLTRNYEKNFIDLFRSTIHSSKRRILLINKSPILSHQDFFSRILDTFPSEKLWLYPRMISVFGGMIYRRSVASIHCPNEPTHLSGPTLHNFRLFKSLLDQSHDFQFRLMHYGENNRVGERFISRHNLIYAVERLYLDLPNKIIKARSPLDKQEKEYSLHSYFMDPSRANVLEESSPLPSGTVIPTSLDDPYCADEETEPSQIDPIVGPVEPEKIEEDLKAKHATQPAPESAHTAHCCVVS